MAVGTMMKASTTLVLVIVSLATPAFAGGKQAPAARPAVKVAAPAPTTKPVARPVAKPAAPVVADDDGGGYDLGTLAIGEAYDVLEPGRAKRSALPGEDDIVVVPRSLTTTQVTAVVDQRRDDLDYCWQRLGVLDQVPSTAVLELKVAATGTVTAVKIGGDAPAALNSCLKDAVKTWKFPETETRSELGHPVVFRSL